MALIFLASSVPKEVVPDLGIWDLLLKKGAHVAAYALLAILWLRALVARCPTRGVTGATVWLALGISVLYAISDEVHQTFVPGRNGTSIDVLIDTGGAFLGLWGWRLARRSRTRSL